jgi:pimeloyl-ACP methyl ester carboxylesterase
VSIQQVDIVGVGVEVLRTGQGRPVLYLHSGDGMDDKASFIGELSKRYEFIAPSHPGFGASELPKSFRTVDDLAYFYLDFLEQQKLEDVVILGVSFGAWIAAEIAIKNTSRLSGLIIVDALGAKFGDPRTREIADLFSLPQYEQASIIYDEPSRRKSDFSQLPQETLVKMARNHESFALYGWSPTLHDPRLASRLYRINVPTKVLWGANDRVVSADYGRAFAKAIPNASFELIDRAGHYPNIEQPEKFVSAVQRFIDALPA